MESEIMNARAALTEAEMTVNWGVVYQTTATNCVCCGKPLRDAISVTRGIGPDCSNKHYQTDVDTTETMLASALGILVSLNLDHRVKSQALKMRHQPRDILNFMLWWAAVNLDQKDTVMGIANVIEALGYTKLAQVVRARNVGLILEVEGDTMYLNTKYNQYLFGLMYSVRDAKIVPKTKTRFGKRWKIPKSRYDLLMTILTYTHSKQWLQVDGDGEDDMLMVGEDPTLTYDSVLGLIRNEYQPKPTPNAKPENSPVAAKMPIIESAGEGVHRVRTFRYNAGFVAAIKTIPAKDRKWDPVATAWSFRSNHLPAVEAMVQQHFN